MIENELKIPVDRLDTIRARLGTTDAERLTDNELEINILFDTGDGDLAASGRVLRIRRVGDRGILTFKGPAAFEGAVKQRREIELEISSPERLSELLHALGFAPWMRYEKQRESWMLGDVRIDLDHTPMGDFVELEGPTDRLEAAARRLELDPGRAVSQSYIGLWQALREERPELAHDMVFDT